ncbi:hypothetical protein ONZ45_g4738 [Pleurotus djamor]|nr:hypothetical protein ONZ45_g4738 [Pleurotus djamor]
MSSLFLHASIIGVSVVSVFSIFKSWSNYKENQARTERRLLEDIAGLSRTIEKKEKEIRTLQERLEVVSAEVLDRGQTISGLERLVEDARGEVTDRDNAVRRMEVQNQELEVQLESLRSASTNGKVEHTNGHPEASPSSAPDNNSVASVVGDKYSIEYVIDILKTLNTEILRLASSMAQRFASSEMPRDYAETEERLEAEKQAIEVLGSGMVALLCQEGGNRDVALLRFAFQTCMSAFSDWMSSSWYFEDPDTEQVLTKIYEQLRESEDQLTAGRWRTLTRTHVQRMVKTKPDISEYFLDAFSNILMAVGFAGQQDSMQAFITSEFGAQMGSIGQLALELNKAIGEGLISTDIEPIYVSPGVPFDPAVMDDDEHFADHFEDLGEEEESVLCTTEMGLLCTVEGHGLSRSDEKILQRPRVVRMSRVQQGTRQAFLPGGHRTGAPGVHVVRGKAKYRLIDEKVRVFVAPPLEKIEASALKPYVSTQVRLTKPETRQVYGKLPPQGLTASHLLKVARGNGSDLKTA